VIVVENVPASLHLRQGKSASPPMLLHLFFVVRLADPQTQFAFVHLWQTRPSPVTQAMGCGSSAGQIIEKERAASTS